MSRGQLESLVSVAEDSPEGRALWMSPVRLGLWQLERSFTRLLGTEWQALQLSKCSTIALGHLGLAGLIACISVATGCRSAPEGGLHPSPDASIDTARAAVSAGLELLDEEGCGPRSHCEDGLECVAANPVSPLEPRYCAQIVSLHDLETDAERYANHLVALMDVWTLPSNGDCEYTRSRCRKPCRPGTMYLSPNPHFLPVARRIGLSEHVCHWKDSCTLLGCTIEPSRRYRILGRLTKPTPDAGLPSRMLTVVTVFPHVEETAQATQPSAHPKPSRGAAR